MKEQTVNFDILTQNREKAIVKTSVIGIVTNVFLAGFKAAAGIISNSIAITLDAVNNLSDAISAARPGARRENIENYIKRLEKLEEIANSFNGVESSYAIQAGREIRIIVKPEVIGDDKMVIVAHDIARKIENELEYPGQIKVNLIRENRAVDYAK